MTIITLCVYIHICYCHNHIVLSYQSYLSEIVVIYSHQCGNHSSVQLFLLVFFRIFIDSRAVVGHQFRCVVVSDDNNKIFTQSSIKEEQQ